MVFSSLIFLLLFLPFFLIGYHIIHKKYKNGFILISSLMFYAWGAPDFVLVALLSIVSDFYIVKLMDKQDDGKKLPFLYLSIALNVGLLVYFKYFNFFIENINELLSSEGAIEWTKVVLPIGISFFTFQKISYSVDVYRKTEKPLRSLVDYTLYIMLFPQLIAGPIVRYNEISSQLIKRPVYDYSYKINGIYRFAIGLAKKLLIANVLGEKADLIFSLEVIDLNASIAWLGVLCYTFQIYFDFSAYSDMAIGLGLMMGFKFPENFNSPYISQSITEFWRRWHITLGSWMRDYLYIPLGGNRTKSQFRLYFNLATVFIISGLWHGASWNFVAWGVFHGIFLILDRLFLIKFLSKAGKVIRIILTFLIVINSWVLFRAENLSAALDYYQVMYSGGFGSLHLFVNYKLKIILIIAVLLSCLMAFKTIHSNYSIFVNSDSLRANTLKGLSGVIFLVISISVLSASGFNPFIYFRF